MADVDSVKRAHGIVEILERLGHLPPTRWNGSSDFSISCPSPEHDDHTPSCRIYPSTGRYHCFGCGAHGDVFDLVTQVQGLRTFGEALTWITGHEPGASPPTNSPPLVTKPGFATEPWRIIDVNTCAWNFLTADARVGVGLDYLEQRGLHVAALRARTAGPVVGYTPADPQGLSRHLLDHGFKAREVVEAGWSLATERGLRDRFRHRVLFPVCDREGHVLGVTGRDITNAARAKYLNSPTTPVYRKGDNLYVPFQPDQRASHLIVCEGPIDALALTVRGDAASVFAVGLCGTAMTDTQARRIGSFNLRVVLMADGDSAGQAANGMWRSRLSAVGTQAKVAMLGEHDDPATLSQPARCLNLSGFSG